MPIRSSSAALPRQDLFGLFMETDPTFVPIGMEILTPLSTSKDRGAWNKIPIESILARADVKRQARGGFNRTTHAIEEDTYSCKSYGHEEAYDDEDASEYSDIAGYETFLAGRGISIVQREQEIRIRDLLHNTTTFPLSGTTGLSIVQEWDDAANADPKADVAAGQKAIREKCGLMADVLQISWNTWWDLSRCESILETLKYTGRPEGRLGLDVLANALGVSRIVVPEKGGLVLASNEGLTPDIDEIWTDEYAFLAVTAKGGDIQATGIGRTFYNTSKAGLMRVEQYHEDQSDSEIYRARQNTDEQILYTEAGFLFGNVATN